MAARACPDEAGRHDLTSLERSLLVERLPVHETARPLVTVASCLLLDEHPLREAPDSDAARWLLGRCRGGGRRVEARGRDVRQLRDLAGQARVGDLVKHIHLRPRLEPADDP